MMTIRELEMILSEIGFVGIATNIRNLESRRGILAAVRLDISMNVVSVEVADTLVFDYGEYLWIRGEFVLNLTPEDIERHRGVWVLMYQLAKKRLQGEHTQRGKR